MLYWSLTLIIADNVMVKKKDKMHDDTNILTKFPLYWGKDVDIKIGMKV